MRPRLVNRDYANFISSGFAKKNYLNNWPSNITPKTNGFVNVNFSPTVIICMYIYEHSVQIYMRRLRTLIKLYGRVVARRFVRGLHYKCVRDVCTYINHTTRSYFLLFLLPHIIILIRGFIIFPPQLKILIPPHMY
jgi:hypothetical protein